MEQIADTVLFLVVQFGLLIIFISLTKFWLYKKNNIYPVIFYWLFGLFFVFLLSSNIINEILGFTIYEENNLLRDQDSINTLSTLAAMVVYVVIGTLFYKRTTTVKNLNEEMF